MYDVHANATKPCSAIASVSGHIAAMWWEFVIAKTAIPFSFAALINSGIPFSNTIGAKQFFPSTLITLGVIFETTGLLLPFIFPLFKPEIYAGNLNNPWDSEPSLSAFIIKSDKMFDVSSSHPLASKVLLARL